MWLPVWFVLGFCRVQLTGASPQWALDALSGARVACLRPVRLDDFTIELLILQRALAPATQAAGRAMCELRVVRRYGVKQALGGLFFRRRLFALGLAACMVCAAIVPRFVFFYEVTGNESVPAEKILRALSSLGVGFGTYGPSIHPQELKNKMLLLIPELQWFTVQQSGMRARVVVRERPQTQRIEPRRQAMDVIAAKDGIITSVSALEGNCLCAPGQAVRKGEVLISAYTDLEFTTRVSAALGEIYAQTLSFKTLRMPEQVLQKGESLAQGTQIALLLGKKRWIIFSNSGNLTGKCDKITQRKLLTLPGALELPLGLEITRWSCRALNEAPLDERTAEAVLMAQCQKSVEQDMIAGTIQALHASMTRQNGSYQLSARVRCEEMIARMVRASITGIKEETP